MNHDVVVIGGGIAGAAAAFTLARRHRVVLLEREDMPGHHSTGRSAAIFSETYGPPGVRALTRASRAFFESPPPGFAEAPLLLPRGVLLVGRADQTAGVEAALVTGGEAVRRLSAAEAERLCPLLAPGYTSAAVYEPGAADMDVHALHQGYLRGAKARGTEIVCSAPVRQLERRSGLWHAETQAGTFTAPVVVNAAGAWADEVAVMAGVPPLGLVAKRRTIVLLDLPPDRIDPESPMVRDADETFYFKPESGRLLASPADATPVPPCDVQPEEIDVALAVDRVGRATGLDFRRVVSKWAGLRTFAPTGEPVCHWGAEGFLWLAGQGGYGIQTAPAMAAKAATLVEEDRA